GRPTTDYRPYGMRRWLLKDRVPVIQINERGRFAGFHDPGVDAIRDKTGLYVAREPDQLNPVWAATTAVRTPLGEVERVWRGTVMDVYELEKLTGWTPDLAPPPGSPLFRWRVLAGKTAGESSAKERRAVAPLMASTGALMAVSSGGDGPFDVNTVLAPIAIGAAPPYLLVVNPKLPVNSTADLVRLAKEKPDGLTFGSSGVGAASHLSGLLFATETGIKLLHVPYKGTGPAVTDLLGGRIDLMFAPGPVVQQFVQSGQLRALGVTDTKRSKFYPDVPTVADSVPGYESVGWFGLLAPRGTPPEIVRQINEAIVA